MVDKEIGIHHLFSWVDMQGNLLRYWIRTESQC